MLYYLVIIDSCILVNPYLASVYKVQLLRYACFQNGRLHQ